MERIEALISKLMEQHRQNADPSLLLGTVQLLQFELTKLQASGTQSLGTAKVAVTLPSTNLAATATSAQHEKYAPKPVEKVIVQEVKETALADNTSVSVVQKNGQLDMMFDPMMEIPTLSHQPKKEVNDASVSEESLNDKLKQGKIELSEVLKESPVKDLRKAIGINDRFLFISDLFRGDESMYERSIKTINSFNIHAEAEYWISRELKLKLGWNKDHATVQHFDQLVKRRFS
jgi:hypothetical protein